MSEGMEDTVRRGRFLFALEDQEKEGPKVSVSPIILHCVSPLLAQSRHPDRVGECPLSGVKRTSKLKSVTSAF